MMSEPVVVDRPVLEDVAEEEDVFAAEGSSCCQVGMVKCFTFP